MQPFLPDLRIRKSRNKALCLRRILQSSEHYPEVAIGTVAVVGVFLLIGSFPGDSQDPRGKEAFIA
jgi:hypothetical protein